MLPPRSRIPAATSFAVQLWVVLSSVSRLTLLNNKRSVLLVRQTERKKKR